MSSQAPHAEVAARLGRAQQRYTAGRRTLVELLHAVAARTGFTVTDHRLELRGLCKRCS